MKTEAQWQAEEDARTLLRAEEIKADKNRGSKAQAAIQDMVKKQEEETELLKKLAGKGDSKKEDSKKKTTSRDNVMDFRLSTKQPPVVSSVNKNPKTNSWQNR